MLPANETIGGTWIREPDGALLLYYSPDLWNDPPTALKLHRDSFKRVAYDILPGNLHVPEGIHRFKPGEWVRIH